MEIENLFNYFYNEANSSRTMIDKVMVSRCTPLLLLQAIFFPMQNIGIPFQNYYTKSWNSTRNNATKQMHCKLKLETRFSKSLFSKKYNLNVFRTIFFNHQ
jgi:hypothetical protein